MEPGAARDELLFETQLSANLQCMESLRRIRVMIPQIRELGCAADDVFLCEPSGS